MEKVNRKGAFFAVFAFSLREGRRGTHAERVYFKRFGEGIIVKKDEKPPFSILIFIILYDII